VAIFNRRLNRTATLRGSAAHGEAIAVDDDRNQIVTAHENGEVRRWDLRHPRNLELNPESIVFAGDGSVAYVGITSGGGNREALQVCEVDVASGAVLGYLRWHPVTHQHSSRAMGLALSPDGHRVAVATSSGWGQGRWRVYDRWTGIADYEESTWRKTEGYSYGDLNCIGWSPDGNSIAIGGVRERRDEAVHGRVRICDARTYKQLAEMDDHEGPVNALSFSHDSQILVTAADDGTLRAWKVPDGELINTFRQKSGVAVKCLTFAPDGSYVVAGAIDGTMIAWNPRSGDEVFQAQVHGAPVTSVAFMPDGSRLATTASDRSLKIWAPASWQELVTLHLDEDVKVMKFSPDGKRLALAGNSLVILDAARESHRLEERRREREIREQVRTLVQSALDGTDDPLQAREQLVSDASLNETTRSPSLRELRVALDRRWQVAYQHNELKDQVTPLLARHVLGEQMVSTGGWISVSGLVERVKSLQDVGEMRRQALAEFAAACRMGTDTNSLAWAIAVDPGRSPKDYAQATFGMDATVAKTPTRSHRNTLTTVQYRARLFQEALESAQRSNQSGDESLPHNVAVIVMSHHRMGQEEQAVEAWEQLETLMQNPQWANDSEAVALHDEAKQVMAQPVTEPWDEGAAWDDHRALLDAMDLDTAKYARWLVNTSKRLAERNLTNRAEAWLESGQAMAPQLGEKETEE
jgi:WD40 repeat protein